MEKAELILVPAPAPGHIVSTIEFAKIILRLHPHLSVSLLLIKIPISPVTDEFIKSLIHSHPNIHLFHVPQPPVPPPSQLADKSIERYICDVVDSHKPLVRTIIQNAISSSGSVPVVGLIVDLIYSSFSDLGAELGIPCFIFFTSGAAFLNLTLYLPSRHQQVGREFLLSDSEIPIPGFVNPVPARVMPEALFDKNGGGYEAYVQIARGFLQVKGIIVNTFAELESYAIESYKNGNCPKVYPVGPVLNLKGHPNPEMDRKEWNNIRKWLDEQSESSVVFLCFGSAGSFEAQQIREIALGLEQSGHEFLWSIRFPSTENQDTQQKNRKDLLPEGFLERVKGRGVISGWAPQVEVLGHKAIGGFVSHCGWNSTLESLWHGVPMATLPIYAEQQLNAFNLVKELGLAVDLKMDYKRNDEVTKEEVERAVRSVMESGSEVRNKVKEMSKIARRVQMEGGSSFNSLTQFIFDLTATNNLGCKKTGKKSETGTETHVRKHQM